MKTSELRTNAEILAFKVSQWLPEWDKVQFSDEGLRRPKPEPFFLLFKLKASWLKRLSGISRRTTKDGLLRSKDLGIQRRHDEKRSRRSREPVRIWIPMVGTQQE